MIDPRTLNVRHSRLKYFRHSAAHYFAAAQLGDEGHTKSTLIGSAVHSVLLGGQRVELYEGRRAGKDWEVFRADNIEALILIASEYDQVMRMVESVRSHPAASALLDRVTDRERLIQYKIGSRSCQLQYDARGPGFVLDLKTTRDASIEGFERETFKGCYHSQAAWYLDGIEIAESDPTPRSFYLVAVQNSWPYLTTVRDLSIELIDEGRRLYRSWFEQLLVCERLNVWPGYSDNIVPMHPRQSLAGDLVFTDDENEEAA